MSEFPALPKLHKDEPYKYASCINYRNHTSEQSHHATDHLSLLVMFGLMLASVIAVPCLLHPREWFNVVACVDALTWTVTGVPSSVTNIILMIT